MTVDLTTADEMLKIDYKDGLHDDINERVPIFSMFEREVNDESVEADVHRFAIKIAPSQNHRMYGTRSPAQFARVDGEFVVKKVDVTYNIGYNPIRVSPDIVWRAANGDAAMINTLKEQLRDLREQQGCQLDRGLSTGNGHDVYFTVRTVPGSSPWTYGIENYGGYSGEALGLTVEVLNMLNLWVNFSAPTVTSSTYATVRNGGAAGKITASADTYGSETITLDRQIVGAQVGDVIFRSRDEAGGVQGTNDGILGLVAGVDDFTDKDPYQTINSTDDAASSFQSRLIDASAVAISESLLNRLITIAQIRRGGGRNDGDAVRHVFVIHTINANDFAQEFTTVNYAGSSTGRRQNYGVTEKGFKPKYGYHREYLAYNGIVFVDGHLCLRESTFLVNLDDAYLLHNGPAEGDFLSPAGGGPHVLRVPGTPLSEYVWANMAQLAFKRRNACNRLYNHTTPTYA